VVQPGRALGVGWGGEAVDRVTAAHAAVGLIRGHQEVLDLCHARWDSLSPKEKGIVSIVAEIGAVSGISRSAVEHVIGYDISSCRARLLERDVLEDAERGVLQFSLPGFAEFVLERSAR